MSVDVKEVSIDKKSSDLSLGLFYGITAYVAWGLLPVYWKLLDEAPPIEILAHRMLWSFILNISIVVYTKKWDEFIDAVKDWKKFRPIIASALIITANWFTYIWAVNSNHIIEASLGYYINPLIVVLLGMIVFKERSDKSQYIALILATCGVIVVTAEYGRIPYVALTLAITFALYGLFKKISGVESSVSLAVETALIAPIALGYIFYRQINGIGIVGKVSPITTILLFCAGFATALPLLWFSKAAKRLDLSTLGFLQFISPTISLLLGVLIYGERFTKTHLISFSLIWIGLLIYSISLASSTKKSKKQSLA